MISVIQNLEDLSDECCSMMHSLCKFKKEYELLALLMENKGQVLTREQLLESVWNYDKEIESRTLDVHIGLLRQKLNNQKLIETVRGVGYRIS